MNTRPQLEAQLRELLELYAKEMGRRITCIDVDWVSEHTIVGIQMVQKSNGRALHDTSTQGYYSPD